MPSRQAVDVSQFGVNLSLNQKLVLSLSNGVTIPPTSGSKPPQLENPNAEPTGTEATAGFRDRAPPTLPAPPVCVTRFAGDWPHSDAKFSETAWNNLSVDALPCCPKLRHDRNKRNKNKDCAAGSGVSP